MNAPKSTVLIEPHAPLLEKEEDEKWLQAITLETAEVETDGEFCHAIVCKHSRERSNFFLLFRGSPTPPFPSTCDVLALASVLVGHLAHAGAPSLLQLPEARPHLAAHVSRDIIKSEGAVRSSSQRAASALYEPTACTVRAV